jgi:hypothetical protein
MDEASLAALDRALEWGSRQQPPWAMEAVLDKAGMIRGFLETEQTTEPLIDRIVLLEDLIPQLLELARNTEDRLTALESTSTSSSKAQRTSPDRGKGKQQRSAPATSTTETNPPDLPDVDVTLPDPVPVDF